MVGARVLDRRPADGAGAHAADQQRRRHLDADVASDLHRHRRHREQGLLVKFRIKTAAGAAIATRTATWNASTQRFIYQTVAGDFPQSFADYTWDAYAFDGTVYSGGTTVEASAANAADRKIHLRARPASRHHQPATGIITTNTPTITWTVSGPAQVTGASCPPGTEYELSTT